MASTFGNKLKISVFGQSHSEAIGVVIDGFAAGFEVDEGELLKFMSRRAPKKADFSTARAEGDTPVFLSGIVDGKTCGAPIAAVIFNKDTRSADYKNIYDTPRPSHADFCARVKFGGAEDVRGGGHFSGRLTAPLCIAGALCKQYLKSRGIEVFARIASIGGIKDVPIDYVEPNLIALRALEEKELAVIDEERGEQMRRHIKAAKADGDSVGGVVECIISGMPAGYGDPMFDGIENRISSAVFGIPAVRGIEFGNGFDATLLFGSENNDPFYMCGDLIKTKTNRHGGVLGGISTGAPIVFRTAFKPTPSIAKKQHSVSFSKLENTELEIVGRHDPCIVPRAVPCVEAVAAIVMTDMILGG